MRNKSILITVFIVANVFVYGQNFEGKIIYSNHFTSKMKNITNGQLDTIIGTMEEYFIKGGNYKLFLNGQSVKMKLYDYKTNRIYNKTFKTDTLFWFDASVNTDEVTSFEIKKNAEIILGNQCDAIVMKTRTGTSVIYYSSRYKVDSKIYRNHNYSNWAFYVTKTESLPLKTVIETSQFKMESTAVEINPMKLEAIYFDIDSEIPVKKSN